LEPDSSSPEQYFPAEHVSAFACPTSMTNSMKTESNRKGADLILRRCLLGEVKQLTLFNGDKLFDLCGKIIFPRQRLPRLCRGVTAGEVVLP
jgi:hypothetical protein